MQDPVAGAVGGAIATVPMTVAMTTLRRDLARCRKQGYAVNHGQTERGVCAIGVLVTDIDGPVGALSVSVPSVRYRAESVPAIVAALGRAADGVALELSA